MSANAFTAMPTMCNPDRIDDIELLRDELRRANDNAFKLGARLHELTVIVHNQIALINSMVDAHDQDDYDAVRVQLQRLSEHRASFTTKTSKPH